MRVRRLRRAERDLDDIHDYIARDDENAAARYINRLVAAADGLADHPRKGPLRRSDGCGMRSLPVGRYLIPYRVTPDSVDIVRIVHGARDLKSIELD